jgi:acyl-coenzyme A thioesterase PaaI-like protein
VLTVEYKVNMLAPAQGDMLIARGEVLKAGRSLSVVRADVWARTGARESRVAAMQQTMMVMHGMADERI